MQKTNTRNRNTLAILSFALASALAAPAFAQSAPMTTQDPAAAQSAPQQATEAAPQAAPAQKTWAELDANGNGSLSASEAAPIEGLSKVFAKADKDGNGELTGDEYKAWLAANGGGKPKAGQG
jgi:hypothetical protein